jgi:hypothetical protein
MSKLERVLIAGSTELPDCVCGREMTLSRVQPSVASPDTELRTYECSSCGHVLRLTVWAEPDSTESLWKGDLAGAAEFL